LRFGTKIVLFLKDFFYAIPLVDTFILMVYTLDFFLNYFSNFKVLRKNHEYYIKTQQIVQVFRAFTCHILLLEMCPFNELTNILFIYYYIL